MYTENDLVKVAKRENNTKRSFLVVNKLQGKHIPVSPKEALNMFQELAGLVKTAYKDETLLLVGFAETATAIGAALAINLNSYYIQTTRENVEDAEYLYFTESHSHATEQKLVKNDIDKAVDMVDRIVFVEDEVTTGNTIKKIIDIIKNQYQKNIKFSVACLLNGMNKESEERYKQMGVDVHYLVKTDNEAYVSVANKYKGDGKYVIADKNDTEVYKLNCGDYINARRLIKGSDYLEACEKLLHHIDSEIDYSKDKRVLVIGTEEFMYPAIYVGNKLETKVDIVKSHSTTRSPIAISGEEDYPFRTRYELCSLYDKERKTFIYDLDVYDKVIVITDANNNETEGVNTLVNSIKSLGNNEVYIIRWC